MASVSVIIPTYNRAQLLQESIGSVLGQSLKDVEVVVVDDGSTDDTEAVVRGYEGRVRYIRQENSGVCAARNLGALSSSGDYLLFLDSDDILLPTALEGLAQALDANPDCGAAYCGFVELDQGGQTAYKSPLDRPSGDVFVEICTDYLCIVHSVMMRRKCLAKIGLFDTSLKMYEDMDFNIRLASQYHFRFIPEHLVAYRLAHCDMSQRKAGLDSQKTAFMNRLEPWRRSGRLNKPQWQAVRRMVFGFKASEKFMYDASIAYTDCDYSTAFALAAQAGLRDPRYVIDRSWASVFFKSYLRSRRRHTN